MAQRMVVAWKGGKGGMPCWDARILITSHKAQETTQPAMTRTQERLPSDLWQIALLPLDQIVDRPRVPVVKPQPTLGMVSGVALGELQGLPPADTPGRAAGWRQGAYTGNKREVKGEKDSDYKPHST